MTFDSTWEEIIDIFHSDEMFFSDSVEASRIEDAAFKDVFDKYIDRLKVTEHQFLWLSLNLLSRKKRRKI